MKVRDMIRLIEDDGWYATFPYSCRESEWKLFCLLSRFARLCGNRQDLRSSHSEHARGHRNARSWFA